MVEVDGGCWAFIRERGTTDSVLVAVVGHRYRGALGLAVNSTILRLAVSICDGSQCGSHGLQW